MVTLRNKIDLSYQPYILELKHKFTISNNSRSVTPVVLIRLQYEGFTGFGEASLPPYLGESQESVCHFLNQIDLNGFRNPLELDEILDYVDGTLEGNHAAKAAVDIAIHDLAGKISGKPVYELFELNPESCPPTSITLGMDNKEIMLQKLSETEGFKMLKIKLGSSEDKQMISLIRQETDRPIMADVNQGWHDRNMALDMAFWLKEQGIILLEQPMPKEQADDLAWLSEKSPIPIFADEGIRRLVDLEQQYGNYNGVNVKLMKSTGLREALKMLKYAREKGMLTMMGCMTETSCAVMAAAHLSSLCGFADLDGAFLISNNPFRSPEIRDGKMVLTSEPGLGLIA